MITINDLKKNDLVLTKKNMYFTLSEGYWANRSSSRYISIEAGNLLLILDNNFGATFKDRSTSCLFEETKLYFSKSTGTCKSNGMLVSEDCFEILND